MTYDEIVSWTSAGSLFLFLGLAAYITFSVFRPSRRVEMERNARMPLDLD